MQLNQLEISRGNTLVREIKFKKGLNLILDNPTTTSTESGNSVGKTTVLRLIDFCLGSDGDDIWRDAEFKNSINTDVYDYLHGAVAVTVQLILSDEIRGNHILRRTFEEGRAAKNLFIDEVAQKNITEYRAHVRELLFGANGTKPSLRQLIPKFVRSSPFLMSKTLKYLGDFASESDYEALHLFLFGFFDVEVLEERSRLKMLKKKFERDLQALNRLRREGEIEQLLLHLRREIEEISTSPAIRAEVPEIASSANAITGVRAAAAAAADAVSRFDSEIAAMNTTIAEFESDYSGVDKYAIEAIYREAESYIPKLQHDWAEMNEFVQNLRGRKQRFLKSQIGELRQKSTEAMNQLVSLQEEERNQIATLVRSPEIARALELRSDLQAKLKQLGSLEQALQDIRGLKEKLESTDTQLLESRKRIEQGRALLSERVGTFNKYFSDLSKLLHGEQYLLSFEETDKGSFFFQLTAVGTNVGSGKKVSQTAAFDLAYIEFLNETKINFPKFVCHDGIESVHSNQMLLLLEIADRLDGQLILATLRDKLPAMTKEFVAANTVLELAHDDKLFRMKS
jgi:uncharacterized protein YydD (DUF2326 family)